ADRERSGRAENDSAMELVEIDTGEVRADPFPRARFGDLVAVDLEPPHANRLAGRKKLQLLVARDRPGDETPRDDPTATGERESPVHRKPDSSRLAHRGLLVEGQREKRALQFLEPLARASGDRHDSRLLEERAPRQVPGLRRADLD